jgi:hypothetical protein
VQSTFHTDATESVRNNWNSLAGFLACSTLGKNQQSLHIPGTWSEDADSFARLVGSLRSTGEGGSYQPRDLGGGRKVRGLAQKKSTHSRTDP